jgi:hypothetical protein
VAELNEYDNEGRLNEMVRDDTEELRLSNSEGEGEINIFKESNPVTTF